MLPPSPEGQSIENARRLWEISKAARRLNAWMALMPVYVGYVVLGVGGTLWLFGVI
jgi:hypothetical protein